MKSNILIKTTAKVNNIKLWEIADEKGISEPTMTRRLRRPLSKEETDEFLSIIDRLIIADGREPIKLGSEAVEYAE